MSRRSVVAVSATMSPGERRAALAALASGARTVEMPAGSAVLHGETDHASDPHPFLGTVTFECSAGEVHAVRARPQNTRGLLPSAGGARTYPVTFSGSADSATGCVRGTVASEVKRYNRIVVPLALVAGVLAGGLLAFGERRPWLTLVFGPIGVLLLLAWQLVTDRREAKIVLADLQRIAAFCAGGRPVHRIQYGKATRYRGTSSPTRRRR